LLGITVLLNSLQPVLSGKSQKNWNNNQIMSPFVIAYSLHSHI
jgi:hypothetical protein